VLPGRSIAGVLSATSLAPSASAVKAALIASCSPSQKNLASGCGGGDVLLGGVRGGDGGVGLLMVVCGGEDGMGLSMIACVGGGVGVLSFVVCVFVGDVVLLEVACGIGWSFGAGNHVVGVSAVG
jgi:hypothetical protein